MYNLKSLGHCILLSFCILVIGRGALATTWHVQGGGGANLATAISSAQGGDTILVGPGTYSIIGGYVVHKPIHIISDLGPESTIIANAVQNCVGCPQLGSNGFQVYDFSGSFTISGFTIMNHLEGKEIVHSGGWGIQVFEASGTISRNIFKDNEVTGVELTVGSSAVVERCLITGSQVGISIWNGGYGDIRFNTIVGSTGSAQVQFGMAGTHVTIINNIVANSSAQGIWEYTGGGSFQISCNDVWNNAGGNYAGSLSDLTGTDGNISADPLFCAGMYYLSAGSPCLGTQTPSVCGGARMGAYPGPCGIGIESTSWGTIKSLFQGK